MRVLHVHERAAFHGGVEQILRDMAAGLAAGGAPQALLHADPRPDPAYLSVFDDHGGDDDLIARFRPDAVLIHKLEDAGRVAAIAARLPTARMVHDHDLVCLRRHKYFPIGTRVCDRPAGLACYTHLCFVQRAGPGSRLPVALAGVGERRRAIAAHAGVRAFLVGSRWMQRELVMNGIDAGRVHVLPPVPRSLAGIEPQPPSAEPEVLFVGQVIRGKGVDLLLRALAGVGRPWHATIVGSGNHLDACRALARDLDIDDAVTFAGWVPHDGLQEHYARAAVSAVPSRWPEPFGMVGIEAMARGRPVVGFAVGGIPDWLEHGVTGLIAPEADTERLGAHIERLLQEPDLARRLGGQAAHRVRERYRPDDFQRRLLERLEAVAASPSRA
jgi:glycosyltransferase involved in cell wall biosynthesis